MEPSLMNTQGILRNYSQNSKACYSKHGTTSLGSSNNHGTQNWTQNEVLIPVTQHVQEFPSNIISWNEVPQQSHMKSPKKTRVTASIKKESGVKEPIKQKRYRRRNLKKMTSMYRGVTKCKGRFESFVWDKDPNATGKKGKTVYIGGFKNEVEAARAHDLIAIKMWGGFAYTNFPESSYSKEISEMQSMSVRESILEIRRLSKNSSNRLSKNSSSRLSKNTSRVRSDDYNINSSIAGTSVEIKENTIGDAWPNLESTIIQSMLQEIHQESQEPTTLLNQLENVDENHFQNQFLYDDHYPWPGSLNNVYSGETSLPEMANGNQTGAGNEGINSFGSSSVGFHSVHSFSK